MTEAKLSLEERELVKIGLQTVGEGTRSRYASDFKEPTETSNLEKMPPCGVDICIKPKFEQTNFQQKGYHVYQQHDTLSEVDLSRYSTGFMKVKSEYQANYYKQHNVENVIPRLRSTITNLFQEIEECANMPRPQIVRSPYSSMSIDLMDLEEKKKVLSCYYQSEKDFFLQQTASLIMKSVKPVKLKTLDDLQFEKEKMSPPKFVQPIYDEVELIAPLFNKYHSDIKEISGLQAEILKLNNLAEREENKKVSTEIEDYIQKKIARNVELKKRNQLRLPFKMDLGFVGYVPNLPTHDEAILGSKYPLYMSMTGIRDEQTRRRIPEEEFDRNALKYRLQCFDPQKVPVCFSANKLST